MASTTGIAWTDATANFVIGCTKVGPGCEHCYAANLAKRKWGIVYEPGGERRVTKSGFADPVKWNRMHERGQATMRNGRDPVPRWVFACSLSDFFDNEWPPEVRARAWEVIRDTPLLRWQIVTKRVGNAWKMLPSDWNEVEYVPGLRYKHVGIIATCCTQEELNRDFLKLADLRGIYGVRWIGLSLEPMLGPISLIPKGGIDFAAQPDWVIIGGESKQGAPARKFAMEWAISLIAECKQLGIPVFMKQMGDSCFYNGQRVDMGTAGAHPELWPQSLRVQQMPTVYA